MSEQKILLITPDFPPTKGGVARYLYALAKQHASQIEVLAQPHPQWSEVDKDAPFPIYRQKLLYKFFWPRWFKTVRYLISYKQRYSTVITSHVLPFGTACFFAKLFTKTEYIVIVHGMDIRLARASSRKKFITKRVLRNAKLVVANSNVLAQEIADVFDVHKILVINPCVETIDEANSVKKDRSRKFNLLTVARLVERKGHVHVLNALVRLRQQDSIQNIHYDIVGQGPLYDPFRSMIRTLGLESVVTIHNNVNDDELKEFYRSSDVFVMPVSEDKTDKEGFGLVFIEAAQYGTPSISTNIPGVDEAIIDGKTGILLDGQDEGKLAGAINKLYNDQVLRNNLGNAAMQHAQLFTCDKQMSKLTPYL
jgi:phosphatidyl-myo-inositol dimannoside synthase